MVVVAWQECTCLLVVVVVFGRGEYIACLYTFVVVVLEVVVTVLVVFVYNLSDPGYYNLPNHLLAVVANCLTSIRLVGKARCFLLVVGVAWMMIWVWHLHI